MFNKNFRWRVGAVDNDAYLTCQIWNEALKEGDSFTTEGNRLNVRIPYVNNLFSKLFMEK